MEFLITISMTSRVETFGIFKNLDKKEGAGQIKNLSESSLDISNKN
jgi:hypothetical protein